MWYSDYPIAWLEVAGITKKQGEKQMKVVAIIITIIGLSFASIAKMETTYGDTTKVSIFHKNGKIKVEGIKVKKFKDGKWKYYDEGGFLVRVDSYKSGKKIKTMEMGSLQ
tara:strand:+ start:373 stop:702 length:330 start_codon:yes stop_codon:yes gene_type:complete